MRVLILFNSLMVGGSERKGVKIANELHRRGADISVAYLCDPAILLPQIDEEIPTTCLQRTGKFSLTALFNLRRFVDEHDISVVLCMNQYPLLYAASLRLARVANPPRIILAVNTTDFERRRDRWFMWIYAPLIRRIESVVYGCSHQMEMWQRKYNLGNTRSGVIYNGVDTDYFSQSNGSGDLKERLGITNRFVIGCVGRLDPEKNQSALLEVVAELNSQSDRFVVLLVGSGPERERLQRLSAELGITEHVHFLGRMDDVRIALAAMDVFVLPSVSVETFSNAALEAMAMSLPVVLSDIGGASEMIENDDNGFVFERGDKVRLGELLLRLESDRQLRERLGHRARDTVLRRFAFGRMVDDYERVLGGT